MIQLVVGILGVVVAGIIIGLVARVLWDNFEGTWLWITGGVFVAGLLWAVVEELTKDKTRSGLGSSYTTGSDRESPPHIKRKT